MGFDKKQAKLISAVFRLGPSLTELVATVDEQMIYAKQEKPRTTDAEFRAVQFMQDSKFRDMNKKRIWLNDRMQKAFSREIPFFVFKVPKNDWTVLFLFMSHWLSINAWNWKLSDLRALLLNCVKNG